jgi:hypothetical protein
MTDFTADDVKATGDFESMESASRNFLMSIRYKTHSMQDDVKEQNVQDDDLSNVNIEGADTPTAEKYRQRGMVPSVAAKMAALVDDEKCACVLLRIYVPRIPICSASEC